MCCPPVSGNGYGEINTKSREQSQEAAKSKNQFESEVDTLEYEGKNSECSSKAAEHSGTVCSTEYIVIDGEFDAQQKMTDTHAAKVAQTGKGATCFRRESSQHLNEIDSDLPAPLEDRELCSCDAGCGNASFKQPKGGCSNW